MAENIKWRLFAVYFVALSLKVDNVSSSSEMMTKLTVGFSKALEGCKKELNLQDHIMQDFYNYWKMDYELLNRDVGCAIMCMAKKLDLITDDKKLHHVNTHSFAKSHGADDETAKQLVTIIHECEKTHAAITDDCDKTLEVSKCFRTKINDLKWAPDMETVIEEVMVEYRS